jgi:hypothetical protein
MKKLIAAAILSVIAAGATAGNASACFWPFCCHKCTVKIRPYNAFTPACCGTMYCDGCMPMQSHCPSQACYGNTGCEPGQLPPPAGATVPGQAPAPLPRATTTQVMPQGIAYPNGQQYYPAQQYPGYNYPVQLAPNGGR